MSYTPRPRPPSTKTAAYTMLPHEGLVLADATGGVLTITLPPPDVNVVAVVKKIDASANAVTVAAPATKTIDGAASVSLAARWNSVECISDGLQWFVAAKQ